MLHHVVMSNAAYVRNWICNNLFVSFNQHMFITVAVEEVLSNILDVIRMIVLDLGRRKRI